MIEQSILANLPQKSLPVKMLESLLSLAIILSIPIFLFPVFEVFEASMFPPSAGAGGGDPQPGLLEMTDPVSGGAGGVKADSQRYDTHGHSSGRSKCSPRPVRCLCAG